MEIKTLYGKQFYEMLNIYLGAGARTPEAREFESGFFDQACARLAKQGKGGWDFEVVADFFGGRGVSILIQNIALDWEREWEWMCETCSRMPQSAIVNFELMDNIHGKVLDGGPILFRRVFTSDGLYEGK